jgi:hypothetical protein
MAVIEINTRPTRRQLDQFGLIWLVFFAVLGAVARFRWHAPGGSTAIWCAAVAVPAIGWLVPGFMRWVYVGMSYLAWPIGFVVSHVVLALVYYVVLTPIGLVARVLGYDAMQRRGGADRDSYWVERPADGAAPRRYFRQF